jgi:hypothetical protein
VDGAIAIVSAVLLVLEHSNMEILRSLRVLRAMKALRVLTRSSGMQIIFKSITLSLAAMANVSMVVLLMMVIFAILGVQLFHGKFWHCTDPGVSWKHECEGLWLDPKHGQVSTTFGHACTPGLPVHIHSRSRKQNTNTLPYTCDTGIAACMRPVGNRTRTRACFSHASLGSQYQLVPVGMPANSENLRCQRPSSADAIDSMFCLC